jgi:RNA 3'-terminal phosphate cyclase (ATP)
MIEIDGSMGEGGGQMLRTALSLSCVTGKGFRIRNIRKSRSKPGLMRQHLVAVQAAARIASAEAAGDQLGSEHLSFVPRRVAAGTYNFDIGTAGSTPLVLQALIPPLLVAGGTSRLTLIGGTHVPFSPSWHYLAEVFAPTLARLGAGVDFELESCGFYPKGGGKVRCRIQPAARLIPLQAELRGRLLRVTGCSAVGNLPRGIAERQARSAVSFLRESLGKDVPMDVEIRELTVFGQGTFIFLKGEYEHAVSGFTALGERGKPAEHVGEEAASEFLSHHLSGMPIDPHLADQLILYLAQAQGPSVFATSRISSHLQTNLQVAALFLELQAEITGERDSPGTVRIEPKKTA